jgi:hypothetical protein
MITCMQITIHLGPFKYFAASFPKEITTSVADQLPVWYCRFKAASKESIEALLASLVVGNICLFIYARAALAEPGQWYAKPGSVAGKPERPVS